MKKTKIVYFKLVSVIAMAVLATGCVNIIHQYSPQRAPNWENDAFSFRLKYQCNGAEVGVYPLKTYPVEGDKPSLAIDIHNPKGQKTCELSFLWLENKQTGKGINPIKVETLNYNDKMTTVCSYSFDIPENKNVQYNLRISDELLGCSVAPIPYVFEKTWEMQPQQLM
jgi:hypothetical protein